MSGKLHIVGELMNNSYARARKAFTERDPAGYQALAKLQSELGADFLTLNLDGTQRIQVRSRQMLDLLPEVIPAIQEVTSTPIAFDNPSVEYHKVALRHYNRGKGGAPILNSLAASREHLDEMVELVKHYDSFVVTAEIDGNFDKRGLPDPLVLAFYFTPHDDLIVQLIILRNRLDI